jgi:hypothetical protein
VTERVVLSVIVVAAVARVLFFAAAFPLFNNLDELAHIDLVIKRAAGLPSAYDEPYAMATREIAFVYATGIATNGRQVVIYRSPEYTLPLSTAETPAPVWMMPVEVRRVIAPTALASWPARNHEAYEPPLYYVLASWWARLGALLGLREARLVYWIRFMDALIVGTLVVLAAAYARTYDSTSQALRLGLPLLVAAIPQDAFYSVTNDALSPLVGGLAIYRGLRLAGGEMIRVRDAALVGGLIGLALLTKLTNVLVIAMVPLLVGLSWRRSIGDVGRLVGGLAAGAAPLVLWQTTAGAAASRAGGKAALAGWSYRPLAQLSEHPILTVQGAATFLHGLLSTLWRGELAWHRVPLAMPAMDAVYSLSSLALVAAAVVRLRVESRPAPRRATLVSLAAFMTGVLILAGLSLIFDFGESAYPSRALPYFAYGRLIGAALLPFAALYVYGLEAVLSRTLLRGRELTVIAVLIGLATLTELVLSIEPIASPYNWFHLP